MQDFTLPIEGIEDSWAATATHRYPDTIPMIGLLPFFHGAVMDLSTSPLLASERNPLFAGFPNWKMVFHSLDNHSTIDDHKRSQSGTLQ